METQEMMEVYKEAGNSRRPPPAAGKDGGKLERQELMYWMEPGKPPMESTGTCEQKMILDGRFLQQEFSGDMMGSPFTGIGVIGYDNHTGKYVSTWMDTMGTGIYYFEGTAGADGKTITQKSNYDDPVQGPVEWRSVTRIVDDNTLEFEMYSTDKSGKEQKMTEMTYTRATAAGFVKH